MKTPKSPLPFKQCCWAIAAIDETTKKLEFILDEEDHYLKWSQDAAYIVEASNNYPKAVDLLKKVMENPLSIDVEEIKKFFDEIKPYEDTN